MKIHKLDKAFVARIHKVWSLNIAWYADIFVSGADRTSLVSGSPTLMFLRKALAYAISLKILTAGSCDECCAI